MPDKTITPPVPEIPKLPEVNIPSTWDAIKAIIVAIPQILNIINRIGAKIQQAQDNNWLGELEDATRKLETAQTLQDRVLAARKLTELARRM